jgi:pSer/pThr/pTyr-binding forkhead associated (FHA) protein
MANSEPDDLPPGTILETDEELQKIQKRLRAQAKQNSKADLTPRVSVPSVTSNSDEQIFRPSCRLPGLRITVYDDGETTGEVIRVREDRFMIGRTEGDLRFPNDDLISSRHVAINRQVVKGKHLWVLTDLQSRNGLFVRVAKAPLPSGAEFLIGSGRYRLEAASSHPEPTHSFPDHDRPPATLAFGDVRVDTHDTLSEVLRTGTGSRFTLDRDQYWIGRDRECDICRPNDPYLRGKHATLSRSPRATWIIEHNATMNGVWLKMPQVTLEVGKGCEFQVGEQRFRVKVG